MKSSASENETASHFEAYEVLCETLITVHTSGAEVGRQSEERTTRIRRQRKKREK